MKKFLVILIILLSMAFTGSVVGQTKLASPSSTVAPTQVQDPEIKNLKEKIATKVAELKKRNQQIYTGYIISTSESGFKIRSDDDKDYDVKIDSVLTKFFQITATGVKELSAKDLKKELYVIVNGPQIDKTITANDIYVDDEYFVAVGKVTEVNKDDLSFKLTTLEKESYTLDVETATKQEMLNIKTEGTERSGFSKIKEGDTVHFVVKKTSKDKAAIRFSVVRLFLIPQEYFLK